LTGSNPSADLGIEFSSSAFPITVMNTQEYDTFAASTAAYPKDKALEYLGLGLAGEAGEVCGKLSKIIRDKHGVVTSDTKEELKKEIGDCCWFISRLAVELGYSLEEILEANVAKLTSRKARGTIHGNGDER